MPADGSRRAVRMAKYLITKLDKQSREIVLFTLLFFDEPSHVDKRLLESTIDGWYERANSGQYGPTFHYLSSIRHGELGGHPAAQWFIELRDGDARPVEALIDVLNFVDERSEARIVELLLGESDTVRFFPEWPEWPAHR
jgi:hypothetical protein